MNPQEALKRTADVSRRGRWFVGRRNLQNSDVNRSHEPIPIVLFISNDLRVRFMESLQKIGREFKP